ncbi:lytic transglycosylase domain-containing protein [Pseudochrobactrum asaccharolyticum]|nr:lytic transglycosylase domain-containing protein [Pseudochrobactrum asaccharolyticum]MCF7645902.1 lytic transglycosylase domain-containing protein [Pseudochrobactrum asaccharolyticum]
MIKQLGFLCALSGAMVSFALAPAMSAPVLEKTNLVDLLKAKNEASEKTTKKSEKAKDKSGTSRTAYQKQASAKMPVIERRSARTRIDLNKQIKGQAETKQAQASKSAKSGRPYSAIIARYASSYGVPLSLAHAVVRHESNYQPNVRGRAGEIGLMQIKLGTARGLGYTGSAKGLYDPATNVQYGMKYLAQAHKLGGGTTCGTILKYNAGHGAKRMNPTSAKYCSNVKTYMAKF